MFDGSDGFRVAFWAYRVDYLMLLFISKRDVPVPPKGDCGCGIFSWFSCFRFTVFGRAERAEISGLFHSENAHFHISCLFLAGIRETALSLRTKFSKIGAQTAAPSPKLSFGLRVRSKRRNLSECFSITSPPWPFSTTKTLIFI